MKGWFKMDRNNVFFGVVLIMIGILVGLVTLHLIPGLSLLFILAGSFLAAYFVFHRNIGFLIPGCILAAVATFVTIESAHRISGFYMILFLGIAFLAIFFIHTMHLKTNYWGERNWPLFPGAILSVLGSLLLSAQSQWFGIDRKIFSMIVPVLLVVVGVALLFGERKKTN